MAISLDSVIKVKKEKHMSDIEKRVEEAISEIAVALKADGGDIELVEVKDKVARVRLKGACAGCPGAQMTLQMVVEKRIKERVPEIERVEPA